MTIEPASTLRPVFLIEAQKVKKIPFPDTKLPLFVSETNMGFLKTSQCVRSRQPLKSKLRAAAGVPKIASFCTLG